MIYHGLFLEGVPQDHKEAYRWYRQAAEQGYAAAQIQMGGMYYDGEVVSRDYLEASKWYRKAAEQNDALGQAKLGILYFEGLGVPQDFVLAHMWLNLSAAQGDENAAKLRDNYAKDMTREQIAAAQKKASNWKPNTPDSL